MKIFVSGIAGFLGSHLAKRMIDLGHEVVGNDNLIGGDLINLDKRIYLIPKFANEKLTQLCFSSADVVSLTYTSATQSGVIPIAYHYKIPILVSNLPGLKTPVEKDKTGLVCSHNPKNISIKLMEMLNIKKQQFFIKNIESSTKNYSWDEYSRQIINFIE